jgi:hypothetical protein
MTQMPSLFGVKGGGHNFFERAFLLAGQLSQMQYPVLVVGVIAIGLAPDPPSRPQVCGRNDLLG